MLVRSGEEDGGERRIYDAMNEIKPVHISKQLLTQLPPPPTEATPDPDPRDVAIEELRQQIDVMQQQIEFLASFEAKLADSIKQEIDLLQQCVSATQSETQKQTFRSLIGSLNRIQDRWMLGQEFHLDTSKRSFARKKAVY